MIYSGITTLLSISLDLANYNFIPLYFRFNLHVQWNTTAFVMNLAIADLLYCAINLPIYSLQFFYQTWDLGWYLCYHTANFRYINAFADWMSVALIAVSRCITVTRIKNFEKFFNKRNRRIIIAFVWIYSVAILIPTYLEVFTKCFLIF